MRILTILFFTCYWANGFAQVRNGETFQKDYQIVITKTHAPVKIDGILDDEIWKKAQKVSSFWEKYPDDKKKAKHATEVQTSYDEKFLYVAFTAYDSGKVFIQSLKRDIGHDGNDCVALVLDPVNTRNNGFFFVVNAYNAQSEDQLTSAGDGVSFSWDQTWYSETKRYGDRWTAEMAIPFKSIRYPADKKTWGINFVRVDTKTNEYSTWTNVPVNFASHDIGYTGALVWEDAPPKPGSNSVFVPFVTTEVTENRAGNEPINAKPNAGFDAKIGLTSSLNLDLTVNPDFSQIEVDRQVTNLTRFNIFFPERRTFFLENADLFSGYGIEPIRPFYSRRIGLDKNGNKIPILFGARITGNIAKKTRIGFMNMQTGRQGDYAPENYTALSVDQRVFSRSVIKAYFLNRSSFMTEKEKNANPLDVFSRNAGIEYNYSDLEGKWGAWATYHHSFKPGIKSDNAFYNLGFSYNSRNFSFMQDLTNLGTNYFADMGFIERIENYDASRDTSIRVGFKHSYTNAEYKIIPSKGKLIGIRFEAENYVVWNPDNSFNERNTSFSGGVEFRNTSRIGYGATDYEVDLLFPISFTGGTPLPVAKYKYRDVGIRYNSDFRRPFSFNVSAATGGFYNGTNRTLTAGITFRKLPNTNLNLNIQYNKLEFPGTYGSTELFLISQRTEINFSTKLFWTTFFQYNTQRNNININSRLQYRFKPMSDLFLVYTDNYFTSPLMKNRNRALVFKLNYWLNL
ncbi:carbohydrate binding family 9 domain-containing protein [Sediminibacterium sp. TEGAF015]|uniref:carbohydrate binding family 9 domain-containing protein n=1 Tax=Sediminibacterium sp. TEGAF015 TaxID=575378 RepID=UPI00220E9599|nr:carbohydrate binding family 9 domain-containing protein [Sediminibacterium sp. TEGAF015]BDQ13149.1 hypothetical protein TEGAF0_23660 [Sediminibacterium sp. TEGAF015]